MRTQLSKTAVASACVLGLSLPAAAQSAPQCGPGFKLVSEQGNRITCLKNASAATAEKADRIARGWQRKVNCIGGQPSEAQAGVGENSLGAFVVTVRFACEGQ
jgi:hypothetical protein